MGLTNPEKELTPVVEEPVVDAELDLSATRKKRIRINGDNNRILELNIADMNVIVRLKDNYPKLIKIANKVTKLQDKMEGESMEDEINKMGDAMKSMDTEMRELVDNIFNSNVCEVCAPDGSMYDLFNGKFRFEHIIEKVSELYGANMNSEFKAVRARINKHTGKYTNGK